MKTKKCKRCKNEYPTSMFWRQKSGDGYRTICRLCCNVDSSKRYHNNKKHILEKHKEYRSGNLDKCRKLVHDYAVKNNDIVKKKQKEYRLKNSSKIKERLKKYYAENREMISKKAKETYQKNKHILSANKKLNRAVLKGIVIKDNSCNICGKNSIYLHGHHYDYSKPLSVIWLCISCHRTIHSGNSVYADGKRLELEKMIKEIESKIEVIII